MKVCLRKIAEKTIFPFRSVSVQSSNFVSSQSSFCLLRTHVSAVSRILTRGQCASVRNSSFGRVPYVVTRLRLFHRATFYREFAKCITRPSSNSLCRRSHRGDGFSSAPLCHSAPSSIAPITRIRRKLRTLRKSTVF